MSWWQSALAFIVIAMFIVMMYHARYGKKKKGATLQSDLTERVRKYLLEEEDWSQGWKLYLFIMMKLPVETVKNERKLFEAVVSRFSMSRNMAKISLARLRKILKEKLKAPSF